MAWCYCPLSHGEAEMRTWIVKLYGKELERVRLPYELYRPEDAKAYLMAHEDANEDIEVEEVKER